MQTVEPGSRCGESQFQTGVRKSCTGKVVFKGDQKDEGASIQ